MQKAIVTGKSDRYFDIVNYIILSILVLVYVFPMVYVISSSLSSPFNVVAGTVSFYPKGFSLKGYSLIFKAKEIYTGFRNSIIYTSSGTLVGILMTMMAAYPLSRNYLAGRKQILIFYTIPMMFGGGLIPSFLLIQKIGLYDNPLSVIVPFTVSAFNILLARTFIIQNIPNEMSESAQIDGCNEFLFFFKIIIPLSKALMMILMLQYVFFYWNDFLVPYLYLRSSKLHTLQIVLRNVLLQNTLSLAEATRGGNQGISNVLRFCLIVVSSIPMIIAYIFAQKYFTKGLTLGSVKG